MPSAALVHWILLRLARTPAVTLLGLGFLIGLPLLRSLSPVPTSRTALDLALAWAFPAALVGILLALWTLSEGAEFLRRLDPRTRGLGEWAALTAAGLLLQLPILAGALLSGAAPSDLGWALPAILTTDILLGSVALLSLIPDLSTPLRASLFLAGVWVLPALATPDMTLGPLLAWLDVRPALRAGTLGAALRALPTAAALGLAAHLLRTAPVRGISG